VASRRANYVTVWFLRCWKYDKAHPDIIVHFAHIDACNQSCRRPLPTALD
jgi:hypothetical protein